MDRAKDAMVADPPMLDGDASAQEAGEALSRPEVRAVFVSDEGGRLLGVVTRKTLVREVVAAGRDPREAKLRDIAEVPLNTIGSDLPLDEALLQAGVARAIISAAASAEAYRPPL